MTATASNGTARDNGAVVRNRKSRNSKDLGGKNRSTNSQAASGTFGTPSVLQAKDIETIYARVNGKKADGKPLHTSPYLALIKEVMSLQCTEKLSPELHAMCRMAAGKAVVEIAAESLVNSVNVRVKSAWKFSSVGMTRPTAEIYRSVTVTGDEPCKDEEEERKGIADIQTAFQSKAGRASDIVAGKHASGTFNYADRVASTEAVMALLKEHRKFADYCRLIGKPVDNLQFHGHIEDIILPNVRKLLE